LTAKIESFSAIKSKRSGEVVAQLARRYYKLHNGTLPPRRFAGTSCLSAAAALLRLQGPIVAVSTCQSPPAGSSGGSSPPKPIRHIGEQLLRSHHRWRRQCLHRAISKATAAAEISLSSFVASKRRPCSSARRRGSCRPARSPCHPVPPNRTGYQVSCPVSYLVEVSLLPNE